MLKMLKTTYKPTHAPAQALPQGWTEHKAPSGHLYYYHAESKKSTYTRPQAQETQKEPEPQHAQPIPSVLGNHGEFGADAHNLAEFAPGNFPQQYGHGAFRANAPTQRQVQYPRPQPQDRPKHKVNITGAAPWVLVKTKLRRRFVHNTETGESLWKFPQDVMKCVVEMDRVERERKARRAKGEVSDDDKDEKVFVPPRKDPDEEAEKKKDYDSDEYEEVEVTDDDDDEGQGAKRQKTDEPQGPVEFNEDDIAFQLAQMEQLAGGDYGDEQYDEAPALAEEDAQALFMDLLNDFRISPFTPWDKVIEEGSIIDDDRYTVLPNRKRRKEVFDEWSRLKALELKAAREEQAKQDPRVPYIAFLDKHATPKLYWPEFRRKYQKEPEMKDRKVSDKDREKWYREHINRLKLPESKRKAELGDLLRSVPVRELNRATSLEALPSSLLRDTRYISMPAKKRDELVEAFISTAQPPPEDSTGLTVEEEAQRDKMRLERERRNRALAERVDAVRELKAKQRKDLGYSKALLREEEAELNRAMKVGKEGLLGYMDTDE